MIVVVQLMRTILLLLLLLTGCATQNLTKVSRLDIGFDHVGIVDINIPYRDTSYYLMPVDKIKDLPRFDFAKNDERDCDEAAFLCMAHVMKWNLDKPIFFGVAYIIIGKSEGPFERMTPGNWHALNVFIDEGRNLRFYDPQNGQTIYVYAALEEGIVRTIITFIVRQAPAAESCWPLAKSEPAQYCVAEMGGFVLHRGDTNRPGGLRDRSFQRTKSLHHACEQAPSLSNPMLHTPKACPDILFRG